jgi:2-methylcitrate dehydratase PrpD
MAMTLAERLADFAADLRFDELPPAVVADVKLRTLGDPRILALADRVVCRPDPDTTFPQGFPGWVRVRIAGGPTVEAREPDGRGGPARPLPEGAIVEKFRANAGRVLPASRVSEVERATLALDTLADVRSLMPLCRA